MQIFDEAWEFIDRRYALFAVKRLDWDSVRAELRPRAAAASSDMELFNIVGEMVIALRDVHATLDGAGTVRRYDPPRHSTTDLALVTALVPDVRRTPSGNLYYGHAAPGVAYIAIRSFAGTELARDFDGALAALQPARALVVDIRGNGGGCSTHAAEIAGRLVDRDLVYSLIRWRVGSAHDDLSGYFERRVRPRGSPFRGEMRLLTDRANFSAAEGFVLMLRDAGVPQYGDTTGGAMGNPVSHELSNGWFVSVPQWAQFDPQRRSYEDVGLGPDIWIQASGSATFDTVLRRAVDDLLET